MNLTTTLSTADVLELAQVARNLQLELSDRDLSQAWAEDFTCPKLTRVFNVYKSPQVMEAALKLVDDLGELWCHQRNTPWTPPFLNDHVERVGSYQDQATYSLDVSILRLEWLGWVAETLTNLAKLPAGNIKESI